MGAAVPRESTAVERAEAAMARAWHNLDMAEQHDQPANVLDRFEARYFEALGAYEAAIWAQEAATLAQGRLIG